MFLKKNYIVGFRIFFLFHLSENFSYFKCVRFNFLIFLFIIQQFHYKHRILVKNKYIKTAYFKCYIFILI